jgi:WD40 repeat protein
MEWITSAIFSPDSSTLAYCNSHGGSTIDLYDLKSGKVKPFMTFTKQDFIFIAFSPDNTTLFAASRRGWLEFWDVGAAT